LHERHRHQLNDLVGQGTQRAALLGLTRVGVEFRVRVRVRLRDIRLSGQGKGWALVYRLRVRGRWP
jgi:hypothetical protein